MIINLLIEVFDSKYAERDKEIKTVFLKNINNPLISKIYVFYEYINNKTPNFINFINNNITLYPYLKQKIVYIKRQNRLTFKNAFEYIKYNIPNNQYCILSNNDIYFDTSLQHFNKINFNNLLVTLLRYNIENYNGNYSLYCENNGNPCIYSQDTWIVKTPLNIIPPDINFPLGIKGCDNRLLYQFFIAGYIIYNYAFEIKSYHLHLSNIRTYKMNQSIIKPHLWIMPIHIYNRSHFKHFIKLVMR